MLKSIELILKEISLRIPCRLLLERVGSAEKSVNNTTTGDQKQGY